jgi:hypothetical protein
MTDTSQTDSTLATIQAPPPVASVSFWRSAFSEPGGTVSLARIATAFTVLGSLIWITHIVFQTHQIPELTGISLFNATLYGLNKASAAGTAIWGNGKP